VDRKWSPYTAVHKVIDEAIGSYTYENAVEAYMWRFGRTVSPETHSLNDMIGIFSENGDESRLSRTSRLFDRLQRTVVLYGGEMVCRGTCIEISWEVDGIPWDASLKHASYIAPDRWDFDPPEYSVVCAFGPRTNAYLYGQVRLASPNSRVLQEIFGVLEYGRFHQYTEGQYRELTKSLRGRAGGRYSRIRPERWP
jgi:hypothetical protein